MKVPLNLNIRMKLPVFPEMTDDQVQYVIETVNKFYENK